MIPEQKNPGVKSEKLISALDLARLHFGWELLNVLVSEVGRSSIDLLKALNKVFFWSFVPLLMFYNFRKSVSECQGMTMT